MDDVDYIQADVEKFQTFALEQHQRGREADNNPGSDCIDCEEEIPLKRRQAKPGCRRCIDCQTLFEQRGK